MYEAFVQGFRFSIYKRLFNLYITFKFQFEQ